jgi:hypothetical protein
MKLTPVQGAIEAIRLLLSNQLNLPTNNENIVQDLDPGLVNPSPNLALPRPPAVFPLPPTNPGYGQNQNPFFPPVNPGWPGYVPPPPTIPNDQNNNGIPDDIDALLGGL